MKSFVFILTAWAGGGTEKVFENVASCIIKNIPESKIYLYVVNGFDREKYSVAPYVEVITSKSQLRSLAKETYIVAVNFSGDWKSGRVSKRFFKDYISWIHQNPFTMKKARTSLINFPLLKKSKRIVCVCKEQKEILESNFHFKNEIDVIYNSVDFKKIKSFSAIPLENIDYKYILMTARIDFASKDFYTVIAAYSSLPKTLQENYKLVFLGDGPDRKKLESYIRKKVSSEIQKNIILKGFDKNPYRYMKNASVNILSSKTEGFGVAIIEAMSLDCPEILTNYKTGAKEVSDNGKNAILVETGNKEEMANAIEKVLTDSNYKNKLVNSASIFVKQFYQENIEKLLVSFFESLF